MKKLALLVYPEFSLQEVMNLARLFRWDFDISTEVISSELSPVKSEEGLWVVPQKTTERFCTKDYACLILPGCSDFGQVFQDKKIAAFLATFQGNDTFPIGAICSAPQRYIPRIFHHKPLRKQKSCLAFYNKQNRSVWLTHSGFCMLHRLLFKALSG